MYSSFLFGKVYTQGALEHCINFQEFQKSYLILKNKEKVIQIQAKQIIELENQIQEQNKIIQSLQHQPVSENPVVCKTSKTIININEPLKTGETGKDAKAEDKVYSPVFSELEGCCNCESAAPVEL